MFIELRQGPSERPGGSEVRWRGRLLRPGVPLEWRGRDGCRAGVSCLAGIEPTHENRTDAGAQYQGPTQSLLRCIVSDSLLEGSRLRVTTSQCPVRLLPDGTGVGFFLTARCGTKLRGSTSAYCDVARARLENYPRECHDKTRNCASGTRASYVTKFPGSMRPCRSRDSARRREVAEQMPLCVVGAATLPWKGIFADRKEGNRACRVHTRQRTGLPPWTSSSVSPVRVHSREEEQIEPLDEGLRRRPSALCGSGRCSMRSARRSVLEMMLQESVDVLVELRHAVLRVGPYLPPRRRH